MKGIKLGTTYTALLVLLAVAFGFAIRGIETHRMEKGQKIKWQSGMNTSVVRQTVPAIPVPEQLE